MKKILFLLLALVLIKPLFAQTFSLQTVAQQQISIIPKPNQMELQDGRFLLNKKTVIVADAAQLSKLSWYLKNELLNLTQLSLTSDEQTSNEGIYLILNTKNKVKESKEAYTLTVSSTKVKIESSTENGLFNGVSTFLQLVSTAKLENKGFAIPAVHISDQPAYTWRGLMLDESRSFYGKEKVKSILDWMAFYKLNRFHWHLTDEPAWRLEIKKYPKLTLVGGIGNYLNPNVPAQYYSQSDIRDIVSYAAERFITVIPEIDMPGHATAANLAYPEYSGGGSKAHPEFTFNPGKEATYQYLSNIVKETNVLFPAAMIHLGGDEVSYGNEKWKTNPLINSLKEKEKLADDKAVERYFMKRMADSVYQMNAKVLVWDEMTEAGLPTDQTIIFWWRHDQPNQLKKALNNNYQTVLCPRLPLYFDFVQDSTHQYGRKWNKLYNPIKQVYDFDPSKLIENPAQAKLILGIQANLWTETAPTAQRLDYLLFPRLAALAEAAWTTSENKNPTDFMKRIKSHLQLYKQAGLYYYDPFVPLLHPEPVTERKQPLSYID
jgi:hexosaminidase